MIQRTEIEVSKITVFYVIEVKDEMRQLLTVRANVERILGFEKKEKGQQIEKKKER